MLSKAMRSKFVQHYYAATFMLPLAASLQQTAIGYISSRGSGVISPAGLLAFTLVSESRL
eukprot:4357359-Amphidinium_carterae.1